MRKSFSAGRGGEKYLRIFSHLNAVKGGMRNIKYRDLSFLVTMSFMENIPDKGTCRRMQTSIEDYQPQIYMSEV
jgi:hypothetical protein